MTPQRKPEADRQYSEQLQPQNGLFRNPYRRHCKMKVLIAVVLGLAATSAMAADSVKVSVGHMCCGACKASATTGVKSVAWVDGCAIEGDVITVTAKGD